MFGGVRQSTKAPRRTVRGGKRKPKRALQGDVRKRGNDPTLIGAIKVLTGTSQKPVRRKKKSFPSVELQNPKFQKKGMKESAGNPMFDQTVVLKDNYVFSTFYTKGDDKSEPGSSQRQRSKSTKSASKKLSRKDFKKLKKRSSQNIDILEPVAEEVEKEDLRVKRTSNISLKRNSNISLSEILPDDGQKRNSLPLFQRTSGRRLSKRQSSGSLGASVMMSLDFDVDPNFDAVQVQPDEIPTFLQDRLFRNQSKSSLRKQKGNSRGKTMDLMTLEVFNPDDEISAQPDLLPFHNKQGQKVTMVEVDMPHSSSGIPISPWMKSEVAKSEADSHILAYLEQRGSESDPESADEPEIPATFCGGCEMEMDKEDLLQKEGEEGAGVCEECFRYIFGEKDLRRAKVVRRLRRNKAKVAGLEHAKNQKTNSFSRERGSWEGQRLRSDHTSGTISNKLL